MLNKALKELRADLKQDFREFWPAGKDHEIHEENILMHLGAIFKRNNVHIYAQVSTNEHSSKHIDFAALHEQERWFLLCEAKRGYSQSHITGILGDIHRVFHVAKDESFQEQVQKTGYSKGYGLILVTCWTGAKGRALFKTWKNSRLSNVSPMDKACRNLKKELDNLSAKRGELFIQQYKKSKHYLLYALFEIRRI
jgi:hypothetical protein